MRFLLLSFPIVFGCQKPFIEVSGNVDGHSLKPESAYWGGPFLAIVNAETECMDMAWVVDEYSDDQASDNELDTDQSFNALQFTYEDKTVKDGKVSISYNDSPVLAWFLVVEDGDATAYRATTGFIDVEIDKKDRAKGDFDIDFGDDGSLKGDFLIENCSNLKKRKDD
jgi:hypothetical protein